ncbi:MAG: hypothetical protein WAU82_23640 [Candidatus Binatus sp.]|uniref:hypothetical protein n=1 Tax=Candidatus Binatus sp. TaxID=2811406 RepID=UPI003BB13324
MRFATKHSGRLVDAQHLIVIVDSRRARNASVGLDARELRGQRALHYSGSH